MKRYESTVILPTGQDNSPFCVAVPQSMCEMLRCIPEQDDGYSRIWLRFGSLEQKEDEEGQSVRPRLVIFPYFPSRLECRYLFHITARVASMPGTTFLVTWFLEELCQLRLLSTTAVDADEEETLIEAVYEVPENDPVYGSKSNPPTPDELQSYAYYLCRELLKYNIDELADAKNLVDVVQKASPYGNDQWVGKGIEQHKLQKAADRWGNFIRKAGEYEEENGPFSTTARRLRTQAFNPDLPNSERLIKHHSNTFYSLAPVAFRRGKGFAWSKKNIPPIFRIEYCFNRTEVNALGTKDYTPGKIVCSGDIPHPFARQLGGSHFFLRIPKEFADELAGCTPSGQQLLTYAVLGRDLTSATITVHFKAQSEVHRNVRVEFSSETPLEVNYLASSLFENHFDLRTISDRYYEVDGNVKHVYEFTANFEGSDRALHLTNEHFRKVIMENWPHEFLQSAEAKIILPCGLPNRPDLLGVRCSCLENAGNCNKPEGNLCKNCHNSLQANKALALAEDVDENGHCLALRTQETGKYATVYVAGLGSKSDDLIKQMGNCYRWSSPFAPLIAAGLSEVCANKKLQKEEACMEISRVIMRGGDLYLRKDSGQEKEEVWRELVTDSLLYPIFEGKKYKFTKEEQSRGGGRSGEVWKITVEESAKELIEKNGGKRDFALKLINPKAYGAELPQENPPEQKGFFMGGVRVVNSQGDISFAVLMTWLNGRDLDKMIKERTHQPTIKNVFDWLTKSCEIVKNWAENSWIHWDIKPGNLVLYDGSIYLIDCGLATKLDAEGKSDDNIIRKLYDDKKELFGNMPIEEEKDPETGEPINEWPITYHVAPETTSKDLPVTIKTPLYSLSALICQLLGDENYLHKDGKPEFPDWVCRVFGKEGEELKRVVEIGLLEKGSDRPPIDNLIEVLKNCRKSVDLV